MRDRLWRFGTWRIAVLYLLSGLFGTIVSIVFLPGVLSVGASASVFGLVGACSTTAITVKLYLPEESKVQRLPPAQQKRLAQMRQVMQVAEGPTGRWWVRKLGKMSTSQREFLALYSVRELPLGPVLISPNSIARAAEMPAPLLQTPVELERAMEGAYDESQLRAIRTALRGRGVTLIQGPPGTGKTRTILGILSVLLGSRSSSATRRASSALSCTCSSCC